MNSPFHTAVFFDLEKFAHAKLFDGCNHVWEALSKIAAYIKEQKHSIANGNISSQAYLVDQEFISIGEGSVVEPGAYIQGPCIIGKNCTVRHGAYIRGNFIAGDNCVIGHCTEVKNAIFLNGAQAGHFAYVGDSILGNSVNLGAGVKCANLKLNRSLIVIFHNDQPYATGLKKFGAIIGDGGQLGCNAVTNPGALLGKSTYLHSCTSFGGVSEADSVIRLDANVVVSTKKAN